MYVQTDDKRYVANNKYCMPRIRIASKKAVLLRIIVLSGTGVGRYETFLSPASEWHCWRGCVETKLPMKDVSLPHKQTCQVDQFSV